LVIASACVSTFRVDCEQFGSPCECITTVGAALHLCTWVLSLSQGNIVKWK